MIDIDTAWANFLENPQYNPYGKLLSDNQTNNDQINIDSPKNTPICTPIYISTQTKIAYLNTPIDLFSVFWKIPVLEYAIPKEGVIKKQMKFNSNTQVDLDNILSNINKNEYVEHHIISNINNPQGRIKFKDVRKISIGLCKKDIISYRCKKKGAFYNCFVVILRIKYKDSFKEIHVKVFNTGKLEIPGIQCDEFLTKVLTLLVKVLGPIIDTKQQTLHFVSNKNETVLINSNFNCGFYINREKLYDLLKYKYKINCGYDPCSYPGIQCEFYYDPEKTIQDGQQPQKNIKKHKISFMIFRTGSVLIVGKCDVHILNNIYDFVKQLLQTEYDIIGGELVSHDKNKIKTKKVRKKTIIFDN